jgi:hypothetical protein
MMKSVKILTAAAAFSVLAAPCLQAGGAVVKAAIPFDFVVADRHLPSGEYSFVRTDNPGLVNIYSATTREHVATVSGLALPRATGAGTKLVFDKHGSQRFLKSIRSEDGFGLYLPDSRSERQARALAQAPGGGAAGSSLP